MKKAAVIALGLFLTSACGAGRVSGSGSAAVHHHDGRPAVSVAPTTTAPAPPVVTRAAPVVAPIPSVPTPAPTPAVPSPSSVVTGYFAAINAGDYGRAWSLGGKSFSSSLGAFIEGFDTTARDVVTISGVSGSSVSVDLAAYQTDGSIKYFTGSYTVAGGTIVDADITEIGRSAGASPPTDDFCGAPDNPWGYNFCGAGSAIYDEPYDFCNYFDCILNFPNGTGYVVECDDGMYSHSGGRFGACSLHGGVSRTLED